MGHLGKRERELEQENSPFIGKGLVFAINGGGIKGYLNAIERIWNPTSHHIPKNPLRINQ